MIRILAALLALASPAYASATLTPFAAKVAPTGSPPAVTFTINTTDPAAPNGKIGYGIGGQVVTGCEQAVSVPANAVNFQAVMSCAYTGPVTPYYFDGSTYWVPCNGAPQNNCPIANRIVTQILPWPTAGARTALTAPVVYTVDPVNGQDYNAGTSGAPFRTMQRCADKVFFELDLVGIADAVTCRSVASQSYSNAGIVINGSAVGQRLAEDIIFDFNGSLCSTSKGTGYGCIETGNWGQVYFPAGQVSSPRFAIRRVKMRGDNGSYGIAGNGGVIVGLDGVDCGDFYYSYCLTQEGAGALIVFLYTSLDVSGGALALTMPYVGGNVILQASTVNFKQCTGPTCGSNGWPILGYGLSNVGGGNGGWSWFYGGSMAFTGYYNGVTVGIFPGGYADILGSPIPALGGAGPCQKGGILNNVPC